MIVATGAGLWWWIILLSTSRGTILGLLFGTLLVVLLFGRYSLPWLKLFLFYLVIGVLVWLLLSVLIPSLLAGQVELRSVSTDSAGRMPLFVEAWSMSLKELPWHGAAVVVNPRSVGLRATHRARNLGTLTTCILCGPPNMVGCC